MTPIREETGPRAPDLTAFIAAAMQHRRQFAVVAGLHEQARKRPRPAISADLRIEADKLWQLRLRMEAEYVALGGDPSKLSDLASPQRGR
jgi:hypothetical protein